MAIEPIKDTDPTLGKLVMDAQRDISTLISKEIQLAKTELKVSVKHGGVGIGLFGAAAFLGLLSVIMLSVALAYFLHWNGDGLDLHWAFLVVFALYVLLAGLLAFIGLKQVKQVKAPERAIEQGRQIPSALKGRG
ncbi:phage holin family protein [Nocardioides astragali]|uniref:Phage holin family protein n=1 Tax=Nocardioides astragali TaxID=1776736 RepID=A0ABW2N004_9ACTN|nr:phage holin family protein [Nocardioides astragali]